MGSWRQWPVATMAGGIMATDLKVLHWLTFTFVLSFPQPWYRGEEDKKWKQIKEKKTKMNNNE